MISRSEEESEEDFSCSRLRGTFRKRFNLETSARGVSSHQEIFPPFYEYAERRLTERLDENKLFSYQIDIDPCVEFTERETTVIFHENEAYRFKGYVAIFTAAIDMERFSGEFFLDSHRYTVSLSKTFKTMSKSLLDDVKIISRFLLYHILLDDDTVSFRDFPQFLFCPRFVCEASSRCCLPISCILEHILAKPKDSSNEIYGLRLDVIQWTALLPLIHHEILYWLSFYKLENMIGYSFHNGLLLRAVFATVDECVYPLRWLDIRPKSMHRLKLPKPTCSLRNDELDWLGLSVWGCVTVLHLFHLFPKSDEGFLSVHAQSLLSVSMLEKLGKNLNLDCFSLTSSVAFSTKCLLGALYLDGGLRPCQHVSSFLFSDDLSVMNSWKNYSQHPLQARYPGGDRHLIQYSPYLQKLITLEKSLGIEFRHISLLARAFTQGFNFLTLGNMETLELLGDAVLKLLATDHVYRALRDRIVTDGKARLVEQATNTRIQADVAKELSLHCYFFHRIRDKSPVVMSTKRHANLLEAFCAALMLDKGFECVQEFFKKHFVPRLEAQFCKSPSTARRHRKRKRTRKSTT
ncbi:ribonuclease 3-like isoform X2 [Oscarella lobularis]|uniref:ribonuclease 3-like isoform X2 n=1 Tax=Oscarella lobularis TaxID=121494 RepID=UPI003313A3A5